MTVERVAAFTGHMVDSPGRTPPRFPPTKVEAVRVTIAEQLERLNVRYGFSSAARGSDLLFLEELLMRNGEAHVFLPFPKEDFARTSVGYGWDDRYYKLLHNNLLEITVLYDRLPSEEHQSAAYDRCNAEIQKAALACAQRTGTMPVLLTVWNGNPGDGRGGTADAVHAWKRHGHEVVVIDISKLGKD
jgi:hypothetical protein